MSALYLLLRLLIGSVLIAVVVNSNNDNSISNWQIIGIFHVFLGIFFLVLQPYKKSWMNHVDGLNLLVVEVLLLIEPNNQNIFVIGIVAGVVVFVLTIIRSIHGCLCTG